MTTLRPAVAWLLCSGCVTTVLPLSDDVSDEGWVEALDLTVDRLDEAYAFTAWKGIDWDDVRDRLGADMAAAQDAGDVDAYDRVLRDLVLALPDGHVLLWNDDDARNVCPEASGALGVRFADTDADGLVVVDGGDALVAGDRLVTWGGLSPEDALAARPLHCFPTGLATAARRRDARVHLLGRAPVGETVEVVLTRDGAPVAVSLTARRDGTDVRAHLGIPLPEERLDHRRIGDVGVITIGWEETLLTELGFRDALRSLWRDGARRLVLDLRGNDGGTDQTAAAIVGSFTDRTWFYETITMYDRQIDGQAPISEVWVTPQPVRWDLPVAVLIDARTVSSGEGMAMMLARFPDVDVVGFEGTAASFGSSGSTTRLPEGWTLTWPAGRSLDRRGRIQLDSDATLDGGVHPTVRIPWTVDNRVAQADDPEGFAIDWAITHVLDAR